MKVHVRVCTPWTRQPEVFPMEVKPNTRILRVKQMIWGRVYILPVQQDLSCHTFMPEDDHSLFDYYVKDGDWITMSLKPPLFSKAFDDDAPP